MSQLLDRARRVLAAQVQCEKSEKGEITPTAESVLGYARPLATYACRVCGRTFQMAEYPYGPLTCGVCLTAPTRRPGRSAV